MKTGTKLFYLIFIFNSLFFSQTAPPYPQSKLFNNIAWDWNTYKHLAKGSDIWPITWADNDTIYSAWGDGWGFYQKKHNKKTKTYLGFSKIFGTPDSPRGHNLWANDPSADTHPVTFNGKASGFICINGVLWTMVSEQDSRGNFPGTHRIAWSTDHGRTWIKNKEWAFTIPSFSTFLNYGKNYAGNTDGYLDAYCNNVYPFNDVYLARVQIDKIIQKMQWRFFAGTDTDLNPIWSKNIEDIVSIFNDTSYYRNGAGTWSVQYMDGKINRYIGVTNHGIKSIRLKDTSDADLQSLGVFESENPWGPWHTIYYTENWNNYDSSLPAVSIYIVPKCQAGLPI